MSGLVQVSVWWRTFVGADVLLLKGAAEGRYLRRGLVVEAEGRVEVGAGLDLDGRHHGHEAQRRRLLHLEHRVELERRRGGRRLLEVGRGGGRQRRRLVDLVLGGRGGAVRLGLGVVHEAGLEGAARVEELGGHERRRLGAAGRRPGAHELLEGADEVGEVGGVLGLLGVGGRRGLVDELGEEVERVVACGRLVAAARRVLVADWRRGRITC